MSIYTFSPRASFSASFAASRYAHSITYSCTSVETSFLLSLVVSFSRVSLRSSQAAKLIRLSFLPVKSRLNCIRAPMKKRCLKMKIMVKKARTQNSSRDGDLKKAVSCPRLFLFRVEKLSGAHFALGRLFDLKRYFRRRTPFAVYKKRRIGLLQPGDFSKFGYPDFFLFQIFFERHGRSITMGNNQCQDSILKYFRG